MVEERENDEHLGFLTKEVMKKGWKVHQWRTVIGCRDQPWVYLEAAKWGMCLWRDFLPPEMMHRLISFIIRICDEGISHGSEFLGFLGRWNENRVFCCEGLGFWGVLVIMVFWHLRWILKWWLKFSIERWHMGKARREVILLSDIFSR